MDPRQSLSRIHSSNVQQAPYPNMATTYAVPFQPHLPPIHQQQPSTSQGSYLPPSYRHDLPRVISNGSTQLASRYHPAPQFQSQGAPSGYSPAPLLPQPSHQILHPQGYLPTTTTSQAYQPRIAPAPVRSEYTSMSATPFSQSDQRPPLWSNAETVPNVLANASREQPTTHVVGSQGRRGILPSAPGRAAVATNGANGVSKSATMPAKDADGKFPCPNCNKTYLHAKHLKRHLLRHTGDRPYMCILCKDTFSRSDILKRHFQKCSVRRGNPTGASHLSNPAAHFKKSQNANTQAKSNVESPVSGTNGSGLMPGANLRQNARHTNDTFSSNSVNFSDAPTNPFSTATTTPSALHRSASHQNFGTQNPVGTASNGAWAPMQQAARPSNPAMYPSASASPHQFGLPASSAEERKSTMSAASGVGEEWNQMFQQGENQEYIFPSSMSGSYEAMHSHVDVKKEYDQGAAASNNYFITPTSIGADGTLGPLLWNSASTKEDPLQLKGDRLVDFCFPGGIQDSLQEQKSDANLRACLTADNIKHFLEQFSNFQGHFPLLHMASFNFREAYDGLIMGIICIGAVYSDRVTQVQVRGLMQRAKNGIERTSLVFQQAQSSDDFDNSRPRLFASSRCLEEIQALLLLFTLFTWHGGPAERASARSDSRKLFRIVRRYHMFKPIRPESEGYSFLHSLQVGEQPDYSQWNWAVWINQEMRLRVLYLVFLFNSALVLYFNCEPEFDPLEIKLPLPCDDAAWDATSSGDCASALGMNGPDRQMALNQSGSLRLKQLNMHLAMEALYSPTTMFQPRTTNVFSKFILVHSLHIQIWQLQQQLSPGTPTSLDTLRSPLIASPQDDGLYSAYTSRTASAHASPDGSSALGTPRECSPHSNKSVRSVTNALVKWKNTWDQDMQLQYPPSQDPCSTPRRHGFCRDGVHFYWLARALLQTNRTSDWQLPAEIRFKQVISGLRQVREFGKSDAARRGEEPGSVSGIDHAFNMEALELDMKKLFCPIGDLAESTVDSFSRYAMAIGV